MNEREMKRKASERKARNRRVALTVALMLVVCVVSVGGTIAWLQDKTEVVTNTFSPSDINVKLEETGMTGPNEDDVYEKSYEMVPGTTLIKDPVVTVEANSEECYLFLVVDERNWPTAVETDGTRKVNYQINDLYDATDNPDGWQEYTPAAGAPTTATVYVRIVPESTNDQAFQILVNNQVTVSSTMTKAEMEAVATNPTLTFKAAAIQKANIQNTDTAWAQVKSEFGYTTP